MIKNKEKQIYVLEMNGFTEYEAQEFLNIAFSKMDFGKRGLTMSHLNEKGVNKLNEHLFKKAEVTE